MTPGHIGCTPQNCSFIPAWIKPDLFKICPDYHVINTCFCLNVWMPVILELFNRLQSWHDSLSLWQRNCQKKPDIRFPCYHVNHTQTRTLSVLPTQTSTAGLVTQLVWTLWRREKLFCQEMNPSCPAYNLNTILTEVFWLLIAATTS
jgi:hypothetical protein